MGLSLGGIVGGIGRAIGGVAKGAFNVAKKVAPIASVIPGPWQIPGIALTAGSRFGPGGGAGGGPNLPGVGNIDLGRLLGGAGTAASGIASAAQMGEAKKALDKASGQWEAERAGRQPFRQAMTGVLADPAAWQAPDISAAFADPTNPFAAGRTFNAARLLNAGRGVPPALTALNTATRGFDPTTGKAPARGAFGPAVSRAMDAIRLLGKEKKPSLGSSVLRGGSRTAAGLQRLMGRAQAANTKAARGGTPEMGRALEKGASVPKKQAVKTKAARGAPGRAWSAGRN